MRDLDIRRALRAEMVRLHESEPDTLIVDELGICQGIARVDLAAINGSVHGYEIKSERDTLARLPGQCSAYEKVFDYITIVTSPRHASRIRETVPRWWGIAVASDTGRGVTIQTVRKAKRNSHVEPYRVAQLLWRDEVLAELEKLGLCNGVRSKKRDVLWRKLADALSASELGIVVRSALKRRSNRPVSSGRRALGGGSYQLSAKSSHSLAQRLRQRI